MQPNSSSALTLRRFQSETAAISEAQIPRGPRIAIWLLAGMLVSATLVTTFVKVDRVVSSVSGQIVPTEPVNVFQALDESIIKSIDVKEGQQVKAGQIIATLDQTFAAADVTQLKQQVAGLDAQITRAEAELAGVKPNFDRSDVEHQRYADLQQALFAQRAAQYGAQLASFEAKVAQTQATIVKLQNDDSRYAERDKIYKQIEQMRATLIEKQAGSVLNLLTSQDQRLELLRTMENNHNALGEAQHQLDSLKQDTEAFKQQWSAATSQELVTAREGRDMARSSLAKAQRHQDLVRLYAPDDAIVLTVAKLSVGSVLKQGDALMTLMPLRTPLEAEVNVVSRDIGFIRPGDPATLKVDAFNPAEHGTAEGEVNWISAGSFYTDDSGKTVDPFYKVHVKITGVHFVGVPANFRFIPGMTVSADLKVGRRSLARYVLGAALRGFGESMREP